MTGHSDLKAVFVCECVKCGSVHQAYYYPGVGDGLLGEISRFRRLHATCEQLGRAVQVDSQVASAMNRWLPIESAPKGGIEILVWGRLPSESSHQILIASCAMNEWWTRDAGDVPVEITHWMPLPEPPGPKP
jgi:hypothetical protein